MAEVVLKLLSENLTQLLKENIQLVSGLEDDLEKLLSDLGDFKAFLRQAGKVRYDNDIFKNLISKIRNEVNKAEDLIDEYVVAAKSHYDKKLTRYLDFKHQYRKWELAEEIQKVLNNLGEIRNDQTFIRNVNRDEALPNKGSRNIQVPNVEEEDVVGFDGEADAIIQRLIGGSEEFEVISIVGMLGLGKTTLANKVFKDKKVEIFFSENRAWIHASGGYERRHIFKRILKELSKLSQNYPVDVTADDLAKEIKNYLESTKYFIVMDDVWTVKQWDELKIAFPKSPGSRVLVCTRDNIVARYASKGEPHNLKFLTEEESWALLQKRTIWEENFFDESHGRSIAKKCDGVPRVIEALGAKLKEGARWDQLAEATSDFFNVGSDRYESYSNLVRMSYDQLPSDLKSCFLYFGAFPQGNEIPAEKLIRLWIAEGFIEEEARELTWEEIAHEKLLALVNKNLVIVTQRKSNGEIKACRVHGMLHEFCKNEAKEENIFDDKINQIQSRQLDTCRRLSVWRDVLEFFSSGVSAKHVRSLLCVSEPSNKFVLPEDKIPTIRKAFPLLRVLHTAPDESMTFTCSPKDLTKLFHLRYIAISTTLKELPQAIVSLWNMQTLIVRTTESTLDIKGDIWQMTRLRHLQTNSSAQLSLPSPSKTKKDLFANRSLQTLSRISPESCTAATVAKAPNLNNLGIQGNISKLFDTNKDTGSSLFKNLEQLKKLKKLKLLNHGGMCLRLPQKSEFPQKIKKLTLSNTQLKWSELSVLGSLECLETLKLVDNAFQGEEWEASKGGFLCLQFLRIEATDLKSWKASNLHFPILKSLILRHCLKLVEVPPSFAEIDRLQEMELNHTNPSAVQSAWKILKIKQEKEDELKEKGRIPRRFKLSIIPPNERKQIKQT